MTTKPPFLFNSGIMIGPKGSRQYVELLEPKTGIGVILFISKEDTTKEDYCKVMKELIGYTLGTLEDFKQGKGGGLDFIA